MTTTTNQKLNSKTTNQTITPFFVVSFTNLNTIEKQILTTKGWETIESDYNFARSFVDQEGLEDLEEQQRNFDIMDLRIVKTILVLEKDNKENKVIFTKGEKATYGTLKAKGKNSYTYPMGKKAYSNAKEKAYNAYMGQDENGVTILENDRVE